MNTLNANLTGPCKVTNFLEEEERHYFAGEFAFVKFFSSQGLGLVLVELRKLKGAFCPVRDSSRVIPVFYITNSPAIA